MRLEDAQRLWQPESLYLNTASFGLPPTPAWDTLQAVLAELARGPHQPGLGLPPGDSAIVSAELPEAEERLRGPRVMAAARAGLLGTSWHVYSTDDDVDELLALLG
jgi:hypothetical protein